MRKLLNRILPKERAEPVSRAEPELDWTDTVPASEPRPQVAIYRMEPVEAKIIRLYEDPSLIDPQEITADSDRVVAYLLATGALGRGQLLRARRVRESSGSDEPLWRVVLRSGEVDEEVVLEAAAVSYGFQPIQVNVLETLGLIDHLASRWPASVLPRLIGLGILPVKPDMASGRSEILTFAASDPTRAQVRRMVETVASGPHAIGFLSPAGMDACVKAIHDFLPGLLPSRIQSIRPQTGSGDAVQATALPEAYRISKAA